MNMKFNDLRGYAALAPMAGVADRAMREICTRFGAAYTVGELTSAKAVALKDKKSMEFLSGFENCRPFGSQLFGCEPEIMALAATKAAEFCPDFIDINMGCPAPKVAGNGGGSALMKEPKLAGEIMSAVVSAVNLPVTVKIRTGWDSDSINAVEIAKRAENAGISAITVHGRTRAQMYAKGIDFNTIKEVKKSVSIPVIANGDIATPKDAENMYEQTGCDFVMIGRAAMGNPFIFEEINAYFNGTPYEKPSLEKRFSVLLEQVKLMEKYKDSHIAMLESRKHTAWYMTGLNGAAALRRMSGEISCYEDIERICQIALEQNPDM